MDHFSSWTMILNVRCMTVLQNGGKSYFCFSYADFDPLYPLLLVWWSNRSLCELWVAWLCYIVFELNWLVQISIMPQPGLVSWEPFPEQLCLRTWVTQTLAPQNPCCTTEFLYVALATDSQIISLPSSNLLIVWNWFPVLHIVISNLAHRAAIKTNHELNYLSWILPCCMVDFLRGSLEAL